MKRLFGLLGLTCLVVLTACFYLGGIIPLMLVLSSLVLFGLSMLIPTVRKEKTLPVGFMTAAVAALLFIGYSSYFFEPIKVYDSKTCEVSAVQKSEMYYNNGFYHYELEVNQIDGKSVKTGLLLHSKYHIYSEVADDIHFNAELFVTDNGACKSKGLFLEAYYFDESGIEVTQPTTRPLRFYISVLRQKLTNALYLEMDYDTGAFSSSVLFGDKYSMEPQEKELLRVAGLSHIVVVSGLHLSIIALMSRKVFGSIFRNRIVSAVITILIILTFSALCGFSPSVVRSAVMLIIYITGTMIYRKSDSVNSLGAAALLLTVFNPYSVGNVGMLLSFSATLGIVLWSDKLTKPVVIRLRKLALFRISLIYKLMRVAVDTVSMCLCASLWTLPIIIFTYSGVSTVGLLANLLVVPFMGLVLTLIALCVSTHFIEFAEILCNICAQLVSVFYNYLIKICEYLTALPHAFVYSDKPYFYLWISVSLILIAFAVILDKKWFNIFVVLISATVLFTGALNHRVAMSQKLILHIPYTGQGLSVILESDSGFAVLRADGAKTKVYALTEALSQMYSAENNVYVDISDNNSAFYADYALNEFDYQTVLRYDNKEFSAKSYEASDNAVLFEGNHTLELWGKARVELIHTGDAIAQYLITDDKNVLIISKSVDCSDLPAEYCTADIILTDGIPDNYQLLSCETLLVAGKDYICDATAEVMCPLADKVIKGADLIFELKISK